MEALAVSDQPLAASSERVDFFDLSEEELVRLLQERFAEPRFRARQLMHWVYQSGLTDFMPMNNVSRALRQGCSELFCFPRAEIAKRQISSDGTRKYLFKTAQGNLIESVMIKQPKRMTLCVSSQVGCAMGCAFCRTGTMGLVRNLSCSEILQQVQAVIEDSKNFDDTFQNIVFMGMGEPFHNYNALLKAVGILTAPCGFKIPGRKITVSTAGLVPAIKKFGESGVQASVAISLNATDDEVRSKIMPINRRYPLAELCACLRQYPLKGRQRFTIEYVLLAGVNDAPEDMRRMPKLLHGIPCKVNLIPYNDTAGLGFSAPTLEVVGQWRDFLLSKKIHATIRWSKGQDISAACGQLITSAKRQRPLSADLSALS